MNFDVSSSSDGGVLALDASILKSEMSNVTFLRVHDAVLAEEHLESGTPVVVVSYQTAFFCM